MATDPKLALDRDRFQTFLHTRLMGRVCSFYGACSSTNLVARQLVEADPEGRSQGAHGTVISAEEQWAGKGRRGRDWKSSRSKALLVSLILCQPEDPKMEETLPGIRVALAILGHLRSLAPGWQLKWPNDIQDGQCRKVCGILTERLRPGVAVCGFGLNVLQEQTDFPPELRDKATSLWLHDGVQRDRCRLLADLLDMVEVVWDWPVETVRQEWEKACDLQGRPVQVQMEQELRRGRVEGFEPDGALRIRWEEGGPVERLSSGDVEHFFPGPER